MSSCVESENGRSGNSDRSSSRNNIGTGIGDDLDEELWRACAGASVYVPKVGETVFYFPQGHIQQVEAYANQDGDGEMPIYKLPSKILCRVVCVQLKAEIDTDEVFAQVTLLPEAKQDEVNSNCETSPTPPTDNSPFFVKVLTRSDTSTHGGCSLPKQPADECLPALDKSQHHPVQDLVTKDLHGKEWCFRHIYRDKNHVEFCLIHRYEFGARLEYFTRVLDDEFFCGTLDVIPPYPTCHTFPELDGKPKRHLLTRGWSDFLTSKKLVTGDACIFLRGRDGNVHVGVRRLMKSKTTTSILSGPGMCHGILSNALHALSTGTMFTVYYRPWACTSGFIIAYRQYMKAMANDYFIGKRFRMQFEDEGCREQRLGGTVVGIEDIDQMRWPGSEWRRIKVQWDSIRVKCILPERVSPWDIEPLDPDRKKQAVLPTPPKRTRPDSLLLHWPPTFVMDGSQWTSVARKSRRNSGVFQGQEKSDLPIYASNVPWPLPLAPCFPTPVQHVQLASQGQIYSAEHNACQQHPESAFLVGDGGKRESLDSCSRWPPACISPGRGPVKSLSALDISPANSTSQARMTSEAKNDNDKTIMETNFFGKCKIFGVDLADDASELPSPQVANSSELASPSSVPPLSKSHDFVQVIVNGTDPGGLVDLRQLRGYDDLIRRLDQMFNFGGNLIDRSKGWHVKCVDDNGNNVPTGDYTWRLRMLSLL